MDRLEIDASGHMDYIGLLLNGLRYSHRRSSVSGRIHSSTAQFWNSLPDNVTSANSLSAFQQQLKHTLFQQSFPDIIM